MKFYVYMLDGQVDSRPIPISGNPSESPNTSWGLDQLKKNNMLPCEINYDPTTEEPDYENPQIYENMVEFVGKSLSEAKRKQLFNQEQDKRRQSEYPSITDKVEALFTYCTTNDRSGLDALVLWIQSVNDKYLKET